MNEAIRIPESVAVLDTEERDRGSILPMILALMVIGSMAVIALLTFATALFTNRPPIEVRDATFWSSKSAMSMAMVQQTTFGPSGCYKSSDVFPLNGFDAQIYCTPVSVFDDARGRLGVITTGNDAGLGQLTGSGSGSVVKPITGNVLVNGGTFGEASRDLSPGSLQLSNFAGPLSPVDRYSDTTVAPAVAASCASPGVVTAAAGGFDTGAGPYGLTCVAEPWWSKAGDQASAASVPTDPYVYPALPPLPPYTRVSVAQGVVGATSSNPCNVFFPGQYDTALDLGPGDHYFASGVYYFNDVVTLRPGARVVAGEGFFAGCTVDAEAAYTPSAPKAHGISGKGATFVFGGSGRLVSDNASLRINKRIADAATRASDGVAIRSVNFGPSPVPVAPAVVAPEVPQDVVRLADVFDATNPNCDAGLSTETCLQLAAAHRVQLTVLAPTRSYTPSTVGAGQNIVQINQNGGSAASNQFIAAGYVFVPNSGISLNGGANTNYRLRVTGGLVANNISATYASLPGGSGNWYLGVRPEPRFAEVELTSTVTASNGERSISRATLQLDRTTYAIKGWTVDPSFQGPAPQPPPPVAPTPGDPPIVDPPGPPTPLPTPTCIDDASWAARYWNNMALTGAPSGTNTVGTSDLALNWVDGRPASVGITSDNNFSAEFTKTVTFPSPGVYRFSIGSDDGTRLVVDNVRVHELWSNQGYAAGQRSVDVAITDPCSVPIELEYYENTGQARVTLSWVKIS